MVMKYRRFGRTEIQIPVISVGGMRFQTSWKRDDDIKSESIVLSLKDSQSAALIKPITEDGEETGVLCLLMPLRLAGD